MGKERGEANIVRQWQLNPFLLMEAGQGAVELVVTERDRKPRGDRRHPADAPGLEEYAATLATARSWRAAVYPPVRSEFPAAARARAYGDLEEHGLAPDSRMVTEFLAAWTAQQDAPDSMPVDVYAAVWVGLVYPD